jgi:3-polyprenyl-4-hydroxybenzoate decarboxylase
VQDIMGIVTDPSQKVQGRTSKMIIDATRQLPEEGGREHFPETNRALLEKGAPEALPEVDRLFGEALREWRPA